VLQVPADGRLRGVRLALDHRAQAVRGQLLFWHVRPDAVPEVPTHAPGADDQVWHGTVLRTPQDVRHIHVVLRSRLKHHLRHAARHGGGKVWL